MVKDMIDKTTKKNLADKSSWVRFIFMMISLICLEIARVLFFICVIFQFLCNLVTRASNKHILELSDSLRRYIDEILKFLSYQIEKKPYPFSPFPSKKTKGKKNSK